MSKQPDKEKRFIEFFKSLTFDKPAPGIKDIPYFLIDEVFEWVETHFELASIFLDCHMNPWAMYALCRYRVKEQNNELTYDDLVKHVKAKL